MVSYRYKGKEMSLLRYANLGVRRPDILLSRVVSGLGEFYKYLDTTRKYLESTKAVKAIAWEKLDNAQSGVWIQLVEPADNCGDCVFRRLRSPVSG